MDDLSSHLAVHTAEIIKDRLYFATLRTSYISRHDSSSDFFSIDNALKYQSFYSDFGPLNLAMLYRYCELLNKKLKHTSKKVVHCTTQDSKKRVNAAFLIGSFSIIYLEKSPEEAYRPLISNNSPLYVPFRDASCGQCNYNLTLLDCLHAVHKAVYCKFLDFEIFDVEEYEHYEKVENGDLNWIVPNKFIAFCGPHSKSVCENGYGWHTPEMYFLYFSQSKVSTIIRLNKKNYDAQKFIDYGFQHYDLFFVDGSTPTDCIMEKFLKIVETAKGTVAVHCKAGLGRTGTLIACYIMKHFHFTAAEAIAWIRICRPGSIIGHQQHWLEEKQGQLCYQRKVFQTDNANLKNNNCEEEKDVQQKLQKTRAQKERKLSRVLKRVDGLQLHEKSGNTIEIVTRSRRGKAEQIRAFQTTNECDDNNNNNVAENTTQGDDLNRIKALRRQPRSHTTGALDLDHLKPHLRSSSQPFKSLLPGSSSHHSAHASPLKSPLKSCIAIRSSGTSTQQSPPNSAHTSPVTRSSARQPRRCTPTSPTKIRVRQVTSPQNTSHHVLPKWDLTFLENAPNTSSPPPHGSNLNSPRSSHMNLRSRVATAVLQSEDTVRHCSAPHLGQENGSPRQSKPSLPR